MVERHRTNVSRVARIAAALLACLLWMGMLAGCGGDNDDGGEGTAETVADTTESAGLSREEIIAQGDAICGEVNAAVGGLEATDVTPSIQLSQRADLYTGMVERLRGLDSDDPELTEVFSAGRDLVQAVSEAGVAATQGDTEATVAAETTVTAALAAFRTAANDYGFTECGGPPSIPATQVPDGAGGGVDTDPAPSDQPVTEPEPVAPGEPAGGATADGGSPPTGTDDGGAAGGTGGGDGPPVDAGGGDDSSTGGFSPGG